MEGNLNRARRSLFLPASVSMPSIASRTYDQSSNPSPPATNGEGQLGNLKISKHRQFNSSFAKSIGGQGHTRVSSETLPVNKSYGMSGEEMVGATPSVGTSHNHFDQQDQREQIGSANNRSQGLVPSRSYTNRQLQPLNEDGPAPSSFQHAIEMHTRTNGQLLSDDSEYPDQAASDFDSKFPVQTGLTRSRSTLQMRGLRDQMQDLRGKISSLKQQAREDHLRRRSLQSLRTPSAFTSAEQWHTASGDSNVAGFGVEAERGWNGVPNPLDEAKENQADRAKLQNGLISDSPQQHSDNASQPGLKDGVQSRTDRDGALDRNQSKVRDTSLHDQRQEDDANPMKDETENDKESEQDESVVDEEYYEPSSELVSERHEDRPDAFDYENFFLHSGMGSFNKEGDQRRGSSSSTDSAETTRPNEPVLENSNRTDEGTQSPKEQRNGTRAPPTWHKAHSRPNSVESFSTMNSFATATEGRQSDGEPDKEDWTRHRPMAGAWQSDIHVDKPQPSSQTSRRVDHARTPPRPTPRSSEPSTNGHTPTTSTVPSSSSSTATSISPPRPNGIPPEPSHPPPPPPPPPILVSAFTAPAPLPLKDGTLAPALQYSSTDKVLVEALMESFRKLCARLYTAEGSEGGKYAAEVWRRRLESARRVLEGEGEGEGGRGGF